MILSVELSSEHHPGSQPLAGLCSPALHSVVALHSVLPPLLSSMAVLAFAFIFKSLCGGAPPHPVPPLTLCPLTLCPLPLAPAAPAGWAYQSSSARCT